MVRAVAKAIFGNSDPDTVHFKAISDAQRIPDITNGTVDIVAHTMTITCDRLKTIDFSSVYFEAAQRVLVLKNSSATSLDDLHGQKVCATSGSDSVDRIRPAPCDRGSGAVLDRLPGAAAAGRRGRDLHRRLDPGRAGRAGPVDQDHRSAAHRASPTAWRFPSSTRSSSGS